MKQNETNECIEVMKFVLQVLSAVYLAICLFVVSVIVVLTFFV